MSGVECPLLALLRHFALFAALFLVAHAFILYSLRRFNFFCG